MFVLLLVMIVTPNCEVEINMKAAPICTPDLQGRFLLSNSGVRGGWIESLLQDDFTLIFMLAVSVTMSTI